MASKKASSGKKKTKKTAEEKAGSFANEILLLLVLAASLLLFISNFGVGGVVGSFVSSFGFGLFGLASYVFPVLLFCSIAFYIANRKNALVYKKLGAVICAFLLLCGLLQLMTDGYSADTVLMEYYRNYQNFQSGGGLLGGVICTVFANAFGEIGAYVLIGIFLIISLIIVTQRSFFGFVEKLLFGTGAAVRRQKERYDADRPNREARAALRQARREAHREQAEAIRREELPESDERKKGFLAGAKLMPDFAATVTKEELKGIFEPESAAPEETVFAENEILEEEDGEILPAARLSSAQEPPALQIHRSEPEMPAEAAPAAPMPETAEPPKSREEKIQPHSSKEEIENGVERIQKEIEEKEEREYVFPPLSLLKKGTGKSSGDSDAHLRETAKKLQDTFHNFGVNVTITNVSCGPTVTRYELQPEQGVKVSRIVSLSDDIKLNLAAADIRIEAPIPGKAAVGIEVPNKENSAVMLRELLQSEVFQKASSSLAFAVGKDIGGQPVVADIAKMPHLLIAGATGSGKSVCINTLIMSILYKASPEDVKLIMIDPKVVELSVYNGIPHLYIPVVTDPKKAAGALNWAVAEMMDRYNLFAEYNVRGLSDYNEKISRMEVPEGEEPKKKLPQIVIIVDELADLMMVAPGEVEDAICRLAQLARAAGIHLIIATQRPSVNVITGLIKANMPSRVAFAVSSGVDSRTILDMNGAEKLLGKGDMLFYPQGYPKPARLQGAFVSDDEVSRVVEFLSNQNPIVEYSGEIEQRIRQSEGGGASGGDGDRDVHFEEAGRFIIEKDKASIGMLQRMFKIGFNRAARIMDQLSDAGVVGPEEGTKPRKILMDIEEFEQFIEEQ